MCSREHRYSTLSLPRSSQLTWPMKERDRKTGSTSVLSPKYHRSESPWPCHRCYRDTAPHLPRPTPGGAGSQRRLLNSSVLASVRPSPGLRLEGGPEAIINSALIGQTRSDATAWKLTIGCCAQWLSLRLGVARVRTLEVAPGPASPRRSASGETRRGLLRLLSQDPAGPRSSASSHARFLRSNILPHVPPSCLKHFASKLACTAPEAESGFFQGWFSLVDTGVCFPAFIRKDSRHF